MKHSEVFGEALWIGVGDEEVFPVIRDVIEFHEGEQAVIHILGLASFVLFINGRRVHEECFLPLNSEFEERNHPAGEVLSHRAYVEQFDITSFLREGKNVIAVMLGNGWYNDRLYTYSPFAHPYGNKKVCWKITFSANGTIREAVSGLEAKWTPSFVTANLLGTGEDHSYENFDFAVFEAPDYEGLYTVIEEKPVDTEYYFTDCPRDCVKAHVVPKIIFSDETGKLYDIGKNASVIPVVRGKGDVKIIAGEALFAGKLDMAYTHGQHFHIRFGDTEVTDTMLFTWLGCRYLWVEGDATVDRVDIVYADVDVISDFNCSNETLNWLYHAYVNTQLTNYHYGEPLDCPQAERRGYTGDGQLVCRAAMYTIDAKKLYDKWIEDIADGQDTVSGNIQYTAPYVNSGGGPGGWGCAIVQVPYQYWKFYGDDSKISLHYDKMLRFFDYLEANSEYDLVTSASGKGRWCLGEWGTPSFVEIPAPFVNNYFFIKSLEQVVEIAAYLGKTDDIPLLKKRLTDRRRATKAAYFNTWDSRFFGSKQAANAFGLEMGLGDEVTEQANTEYYTELGALDTGIFGADVLIRHLFETGQGELAVSLLTADAPRGYGEWKKRGLTTLPEAWIGGRSLNHPMFGAVVSNLFEYVLGISQATGSVAFEETVIAPLEIAGLDYAEGYTTTPYGKIAVSYVTESGRKYFTVQIPEGIKATFRMKNMERELTSGINTFSVE